MNTIQVMDKVKEGIRKGYALGLLLVALLLSACGGSAVTPETLPEIVYGEDVCHHCGMIINDERFAAALVVQTQPEHYEHRIFDDIGDMFAYMQENKTGEGEAVTIVSTFVHDYESGEWLNANEAHFVQSSAVMTPMGTGLVAFAGHEAAEAQAQAWQATVIDFQAALEQAAMGHSHAEH